MIFPSRSRGTGKLVRMLSCFLCAQQTVAAQVYRPDICLHRADSGGEPARSRSRKLGIVRMGLISWRIGYASSVEGFGHESSRNVH